MADDSVNLVNPAGNLVSIPKDASQDALSNGYRPASPQEVNAHFEKQEYTSGINPFLAGAAGFARGLTIGTSDPFMTATGLVKPETLKKLEEYNPGESLTGETGAIGLSMLVPGEGEVSAAGGAARAAARTAAKGLTAPVRAIAAGGQAITGVARAALPVGESAMARIGYNAIAHGAGGAAEGAAFGAGRLATEHAFGDPDINGEKILSHVGMGALLGGTLGASMGFTGQAANEAIAGLKKKMPGKTQAMPGDVSIADTPVGKEAYVAAPEGTLERSMQDAGYGSEKIAEVMGNANHLKPNAGEIIRDSQIAGLSPLEGQISAKKSVQHTQTMLLDRPGLAGEQQRAVFDKNWNQAGKNFEEPLQTGSQKSAHEMGLEAKNVLKEQIDAVYKPIQEGYDSLGSTRQAVEIPDKPRLNLISDLLEESENATKGSIGGPRQKQFEHWAERLSEQKTLAHYTSIESEIGKAERASWRSGMYDDASAMGEIKDYVRKFNHEQIAEAHKNFALESGMPLAEAEKMADAFSARTSRLTKEYRQFVETLGDLSGAVKLGKVRTYREAMEALEKIEPSKLAEAAFRGDRIKALTKLQKDFPAAFDLFSIQKKQELLEKLMVDGKVNPRKAFKLMDDVPKEIKNMLFNTDQIEKMRATKTWVEALPEDWAPSKTPRGMMYMDYFSSPIKAAMSEGMGFAQAAYLKAHSVEELHSMSRISSVASKITDKIQAGAKGIFKAGKDIESKTVGFAGAKIAEKMADHESQKKIISKINELHNNPDKFIEHLEKSTSEMYGAAPETSGAVHAAAVRAVQYLAQSAPEMKSPYPLGDDPIPSKVDIHIFAERVHALSNPTHIMKELRQGTLVPAHIEAVQTVYPKLFQEMQQSVMQELTGAIAKKTPINYKTKNMLSLFLNQDLDASITPQAIMANQVSLGQSQMNSQQQDQMMMAGGKTTQGGLGKMNMANNMKTSMQQSSERNKA